MSELGEGLVSHDKCRWRRVILMLMNMFGLGLKNLSHRPLRWFEFSRFIQSIFWFSQFAGNTLFILQTRCQARSEYCKIVQKMEKVG